MGFCLNLSKCLECLLYSIVLLPEAPTPNPAPRGGDSERSFSGQRPRKTALGFPPSPWEGGRGMGFCLNLSKCLECLLYSIVLLPEAPPNPAPRGGNFSERSFSGQRPRKTALFPLPRGKGAGGWVSV